SPVRSPESAHWVPLGCGDCLLSTFSCTEMFAEPLQRARPGVGGGVSIITGSSIVKKGMTRAFINLDLVFNPSFLQCGSHRFHISHGNTLICRAVEAQDGRFHLGHLVRFKRLTIKSHYRSQV